MDADETVVQNLGLEYAFARRGVDYDRDLHQRWQREGVDELAPMPGAVTALRAIREAGVKVIFNTNRDSQHAATTAAALNKAGLGPAGRALPDWDEDGYLEELGRHYAAARPVQG